MYAWDTARNPVLLPGAAGQDLRYPLVAQGRAWLDHNYAMRLDGGRFVAEGAGARVAAAALASGRITVEIGLSAPPGDGWPAPADPVSIVTLLGANGAPEFSLREQRESVIATWRSGGGAELFKTAAFKAPAGPAPAQIVITAAGSPTSGEERFYVNGALVAVFHTPLQLVGWSPARLIFGSLGAPASGWRGSEQNAAFFPKALSAVEVAREYHAALQEWRARPVVPLLEIQATLSVRSSPPTVAEVMPYRDGLVTDEYTVEKVLRGRYTGKKIRVASWAILDRQVQPVSTLAPGSQVHLVLEPFEMNPQVQTTYLKDTLPENFDLPLFLAVG